jgi:leucyl-tRNA synthetase
MLDHPETLASAAWPAYNADLARADEVVVPVQVNGKLRARVTMPADLPEAEIRERVLADATVKPHIDGRVVRKVVVAKGPLVSLVVG